MNAGIFGCYTLRAGGTFAPTELKQASVVSPDRNTIPIFEPFYETAGEKKDLFTEVDEIQRELSLETQTKSWNTEKARRREQVHTEVPTGEGHHSVSWDCVFICWPSS